MEITHTKQGDYLLPDLILKHQKEEFIGKYGLIRLNYLKVHKKALYQNLLSKDELSNHLIEIDKIATERVEMIIKELAEKNSVDEELKTTNQLKWVGIMNSIKAIAEEIILNELICN